MEVQIDFIYQHHASHIEQVQLIEQHKPSV
jgi:hypothetical protein